MNEENKKTELDDNSAVLKHNGSDQIDAPTISIEEISGDADESTKETIEHKDDTAEDISEIRLLPPEETTLTDFSDDIGNSESPDSTQNAEEPQSTENPETKDKDTDHKPKKASQKCHPIIKFLFDTVEMLAISIGIVILLVTFVVRYSPVSGESMTYTINEDDCLLVQIAFYTPQKNDIVILQAPDYDLNKPLIKRVIATGGDTLEINFNTWEVKVNGNKLDEAYVRHNPFEYNPNGDDIPTDTPMSHQDIYKIPQGTFDAETNTFKATVPQGKIFVMGDNRNNSHDSRSSNVGFVDERCVVGKAFFRISPISDFGPLE